MTYDQAKLIIWNKASYSQAEIQRACAFILGTLDVSDEDYVQAVFCLAYPKG